MNQFPSWETYPTNIFVHIQNGMGTMVFHFNFNFFDYPGRLLLFSYDSHTLLFLLLIRL